MMLPTALHAIVEALRTAGAIEEMIAAAVTAGGESQTPHRAREAARKVCLRKATMSASSSLLRTVERTDT
jgi:hypothetical protein